MTNPFSRPSFLSRLTKKNRIARYNAVPLAELGLVNRPAAEERVAKMFATVLDHAYLPFI
jgi:hypothetical protein